MQVYRYMYSDIIRLTDFGHLLDLEGIQVTHPDSFSNNPIMQKVMHCAWHHCNTMLALSWPAGLARQTNAMGSLCSNPARGRVEAKAVGRLVAACSAYAMLAVEVPWHVAARHPYTAPPQV
jgi:hypothetical protein